MPFKSEKQRRYLWANEPEIAREWTDRYGSRIKKATGGGLGLYEGWEGLGNPFPTAISQFVNYLTGGNDVSNFLDIAPTGPYQDVIQEGILGALNRQSGLNQGDFSRLVKADDYGGFKIGESFKSADSPVQFASMLPSGLPKELLEMVKVGIGDPTANVANTLGDFQFDYKPPAYDFDDDYMGIRDKYNFPTSDFFPGSSFNMSGEITNADQKREIRDAIFDLQSKQRISDLAKGNPSVMQPHDWNFVDPDPWGNKRMEEEKIDETEEESWSWPEWLRPGGIWNALINQLPNRTQVTPRDRAINRRYMNLHNVGIDDTGRMTGGLFAGKNAPGTSAFGSANIYDMANKWHKKYGGMNYTTPEQQKKQKKIANIVKSQQTGGNNGGNNNSGGGWRGGAPTHSTRDDLM